MHLQMVSVTTVVSLMAALTSLLTSLIAVRKARRLARAGYLLESDFENSLGELSRDLDTLSRQNGEQARKIAWLETRMRPVPSEELAVVGKVSAVSNKPNITERRHRVLSLARRGQDAYTIAHTLGMQHGEVELMMNLLKAA